MKQKTKKKKSNNKNNNSNKKIKKTYKILKHNDIKNECVVKNNIKYELSGGSESKDDIFNSLRELSGNIYNFNNSVDEYINNPQEKLEKNIDDSYKNITIKIQDISKRIDNFTAKNFGLSTDKLKKEFRNKLEPLEESFNKNYICCLITLLSC